jgi:hypothetical protein
MRSEISDQDKVNAIEDFLEIHSFQLQNTNIGEEKVYAGTYKDFQENAKLPQSYVSKMCNSKYFNHFYSKELIETIREKWTKSNLSDAITLDPPTI